MKHSSNITSNRIAIAAILLFILLTGGVLFTPSLAMGMTCSQLFTLAVKSTTVSASGKSPLFRIPHHEFIEEGNDGLSYLNPSQTLWQNHRNDHKNLKIKIKKPTQKLPEAFIQFEGIFDQGHKIILEANETATRGGTEFSDSPNKWGNATAIRIRVASNYPEQIHTLIIGKGANALRLSFTAPTEPTDIMIPIPKKRYDPDLFSTSISLEFNKTKNHNKISLSIFGPIVFERNIFIQNSQAFNYVLTHFIKDFGFEPNKYKTSQEIIALSMRNLANPKNQQKALSIAKAGEDAVLLEIQRLGFLGEFNLTEKIDTSSFFITSHENLFQNEAMVPAETGEFALEHGRSSHALQLIAMTSGMSNEQLTFFRNEIYRKFFTRQVNRWAAWDLLFDAPGDTHPNSPMWWRKQTEQK